MFFGPFQVAGNIDLSSLKDLSIREYCMVLPLLILVLLLGIMPSWLLRYINPVIDQLSMLVEGK
jgi:NADH:ubiquinone oxidoreductase subunit 4 (subunit M)